MYDVADSAFTTVIITALYAPYFSKIVVGDPQRADFLWGLAASISELVVALVAPILGAIADFSGSRKKFLAACAIGDHPVYGIALVRWPGHGDCRTDALHHCEYRIRGRRCLH